MISTSRLELSLYRALHLCKTAFHPHIGSKECGGGGEKEKKGGSKSADREIVPKMPREGCTEKPQSGSCDCGIVRLRGKCSGLALQRAV